MAVAIALGFLSIWYLASLGKDVAPVTATPTEVVVPAAPEPAPEPEPEPTALWEISKNVEGKCVARTSANNITKMLYEGNRLIVTVRSNQQPISEWILGRSVAFLNAEKVAVVKLTNDFELTKLGDNLVATIAMNDYRNALLKNTAYLSIGNLHVPLEGTSDMLDAYTNCLAN